MSRVISREVPSNDPHAYLKWPRLIVFNLNGALSIVATGLAAQCTPFFLALVFLLAMVLIQSRSPGQRQP